LGVAGSVFFCPPFFCLPEWLQQKNGGQKNTQVVLVRGMAKDWLIGFRFWVLGFRPLAKASTALGFGALQLDLPPENFIAVALALDQLFQLQPDRLYLSVQIAIFFLNQFKVFFHPGKAMGNVGDDLKR
jgi:hypothetical protein